MSYDVVVRDDQEVVQLLFHGDVSLDDLEQSRTAAVAALKANRFGGLMTDFRAAKVTCSLSEIFRFNVEHTTVLPPGTRVAVVTATEELTETAVFSANVAQNRGIQLKAFGDISAAEKWLAD